MEVIPLQRPRKLARIVDVMQQTSVDIIKEKRKALESSDPAIVAEITNKKDIISILSASCLKLSYCFFAILILAVRANTTASEEDRLTDEEVIGQVSELLFSIFKKI